MTPLSVMLHTVVGNLKRTGTARMSTWEFNVRMWTGLVYFRLLCNLLNFLVEYYIHQRGTTKNTKIKVLHKIGF